MGTDSIQIHLAVKRNTERRLQIMDQLLSAGNHIRDRERFLKLVNERRQTNEDPIRIDQLSKLIEKLKDLLIPYDVKLIYSPSGGYRYSEPGFSLFKKEIQERDKHLLMLASSIFGIFRGTPLQERFGELVNKVLKDTVSSGPIQYLEKLHLVQIGNGPSYKGTSHIPEIVNAIIEKESLEIKYTNQKKQTSKKIICPYLLRQYNDRWFLVGYDHLCDRPEKTNVYALDAIQEMKKSDNPYYVDPHFKADDFFNYCLGIWHYHHKEPEKIVLEFSQNMEEVLTAPIHHSQKANYSPDGKKLIVEILVYNTPELEKLVLGFGNAVRVLEPVSLQQIILQKAKEIKELYRS